MDTLLLYQHKTVFCCKTIQLVRSVSMLVTRSKRVHAARMVSRDRIVVSTLRCGRSNPGSNPGHGTIIMPIFYNKRNFLHSFCPIFQCCQKHEDCHPMQPIKSILDMCYLVCHSHSSEPESTSVLLNVMGP